MTAWQGLDALTRSRYSECAARATVQVARTDGLPVASEAPIEARVARTFRCDYV